MAFIRTKKFKMKGGTIVEYAYIVENKWKRKTAKQKSKKYLGKVYRLDRANMMDFYEHYGIADTDLYLESNAKEDIIRDVVALELFNYGFKENNGLWVRDECVVNLKSKKIRNAKGNPIAIAMNEGYLTEFALRKLLSFIAYYEEDGYDYAKMFIEAGVAIPNDVFVGVFGKIYK